ncbi:GGDEF domain-containing protein [Aquibacillus kalidii]|uniref:GGDEF domain-containing protein n=1 Tax=Aquibacillus kalidii TaxID=2762597 RepID=UPI0016443015|nr:GGDEF domain-containing protein [Aquibacillus kalidii]
MNELNSFSEFKRKLYIRILPILIVACLIGVFYIEKDDHLNRIVIPILIIVFGFSWLFMVKKRAFGLMEIINLIIITVIYLLKSFEIIYHDMVQNYQFTTGNSTYWTPLAFVLMFVTLKNNKGFIYALIIWLFTVSIGFSAWGDIPYQSKESLIQYYLSILVYIIFLYFARYVIASYTESEVLKKIAFQDPLTGIANRRQVYSWLEEGLENNLTISIIFIDLDHFKRINDDYGHVIGDKILKQFSSLIQDELHLGDRFGRWGGEEFIIVSYDRDEESSVLFAERLKHIIEAYSFTGVKNITASFGVATSNDQDTAELLIDHADKALYQSKENGRNRVSLYAG